MALAMFDTNLRYVHASREWREEHDLPDDDLRGRSHEDKEIIPNLSEVWQTLASGGDKLRQGEHCIARADGTVGWLRWEVRVWWAADGNVGGAIAFTEDISERKRADAVNDAVRCAES